MEAAIDLGGRARATGDRVGALAALHQALAFDNPATEYPPDGSPIASLRSFGTGSDQAVRRRDEIFPDLDATPWSPRGKEEGTRRPTSS